MIKITEIKRTNSAVTMRLEGHVVGSSVESVRTEFKKLLSEGLSVEVEMQDVSFADRQAISLLSKLKNRGVDFRNCSSYIAAQLENSGRQRC